MTTTSRIPAVTDAFVTAVKAALPNAQVFDGPFLTVPDGDYMTIGWLPEAAEATSGGQEWASLGNKARDEKFDIPCYCDSLSGSTDMSARRAAAFALMAAAENVLRADPTLSGSVPQPGWAEIGLYQTIPAQTKRGASFGVVFHVLVQTRI